MVAFTDENRPPDAKKARDGACRPGRRLSIKPEILRDGKEESYERNPGGVPLVLNQSFFETQKSFKKLAQPVEKPFSTG